MRNGGSKGFRIGALGLAAVVVALVGPGVATVSAKSGSAPLTVSKMVAAAPATPVVAASVSDVVVVTKVAPAAAKRRLRRLMQQDLNGELILASAALIKKHHAKPFGSEIEVEIAGKPYVARIERHFHPEGGAIKPWGYHPGVSLFAVR